MTTDATELQARQGYARGRATREEILDAAMRLFGDVGYHTASLREVASRVGISHPGLLHHFASKAVLLAAVLERRDEVDRVDFREDLERGVEFFDALARLADRNATRPGIVALYATLSAEATSPEHPAHGYFQERYVTVLDGATRELESLRSAGRLRQGVDPRTAARLVVAGMDGLQLQWLLEADGAGERVDMGATIRALYRSLLVD
ncbi:TetR/AcrR family transcriptional regulator [Cellulomonas edaphi]|uniref:Helix-turn-helix domain-containing protein n=1 Tax=Cellulomonas edaphi TaxID=3053468 RepID=A0ABT7S3Z4_9CELL|nr:TetR/AcrR family transcriptional regulator [Cellulomons edaphi]MDM7830340.1 helix-turn-helix domain-containing protein [Cellulomons edaphi]